MQTQLSSLILFKSTNKIVFKYIFDISKVQPSLPVRRSREERDDRGARSRSSIISSSRRSRCLITTTGGAFCSGRDSVEGPGEFVPRPPRRWRMARTRRRGIDMMMTTSSRDIWVTSTRLTARISSKTLGIVPKLDVA